MNLNKFESKNKTDISGEVVDALELIKNYIINCDFKMCECCYLYHICKSEICDWDLSFTEEFNVVYK